MKILMDAYGGDHAPLEAIKGAVEYVADGGQSEICLVGKVDEIKQIMADNKFSDKNISFMNATEVITNEESPTDAFKRKPDSTITVALNALKAKEYDAFVSAGSTGALLTACVLKLGRIKGVSRPALSTLMPKPDGGLCMFLDCGANADCKPIQLVHFAIMADVYMKKIFGIKRPKIGLLCNGTEDKKGNELTHAVFALLKQIPSLNFVGNVEGRDILSGVCDVVVADGFSGNCSLKAIEGAVNVMLGTLKENIMESNSAKFGFLFMKKAFKKTMAKLDYTKRGGAVFLGVNGIVAKSHGASKATSFKATLFQAEEAVSRNVNEEIFERLQADEVKNLVLE
ncbi:MAG: phosphate acyltransferase PlsX [Clostridia bacterium]|nr:phosphate acyltransferase PlsX [Clostridia bacterium]